MVGSLLTGLVRENMFGGSLVVLRAQKTVLVRRRGPTKKIPQALGTRPWPRKLWLDSSVLLYVVSYCLCYYEQTASQPRRNLSLHSGSCSQECGPAPLPKGKRSRSAYPPKTERRNAATRKIIILSILDVHSRQVRTGSPVSSRQIPARRQPQLSGYTAASGVGGVSLT